MADMMKIYRLSAGEFNFDHRYRKRGKVSKALRWRVLDRDKFRCLKCDSSKQLTMDHIDPISHGGLTTYNNLQTLCLKCNSKKGSNTKDYRK